ATSLSLNVVIQHLLGSALGPIFVGILSDRFDIGTALSFLPLFLCLAAVLFIIGSFSYESDFNKAEKVAIQIEE
ncbi:MAG: multidrug DMT transporter permease, partial [Deltaproteobacteria bacterium]|nr:multidrug DMT transporter permease [Deltaproteobacteria bacterium]